MARCNNDRAVVFQDKEQFFSKLTSDEDIGRRILGQYLLVIIFAYLYGVVMGCYNGWEQAISSGIKVPVFLTLTLVVCFPGFYINQFVLGSKLGLLHMLNVILKGFLMVSLIMVAFAPIVIFFLITGDNYAFIKLLHVGIFSISGFFGAKTMIEALRYCCEKSKVYPKVGVVVFRFWVIILAFVGMQLAWNLRPFIGNRGMKFEVFREPEGNFYLAVIDSVLDIAEGDKEGAGGKDE